MTREFFEEVMRIPSYSRHEGMMIEYITAWGKSHGCTVKTDGKKNVYLTKGKPGSGQFYPAFINHMDTVHHDQQKMVEQKVYKQIVWEGDKVTAVNPLESKTKPIKNKSNTSNKSNKFKQLDFFKKDDDVTIIDDVEIKESNEESVAEPVETGKQTGLGMDDQGGCAIALDVLNSIPFGKALFVVEEEIGMQGSKAADMHFFDDCAFVFSNDSPDRNRGTHYSSGVQLYSDEFFKEHLQKICSDHGLTDFRSEPYTDIIQARNHTLPNGEHLECLNFGNGGYNPHSDTEYAKFSDVCAAVDLLKDLCTKIPLNKQYTSDIKEMYSSRSGYYGGGYYGGGYYGGGYSSWKRSQNNDDVDSWWNKVIGNKTQSPKKDFSDKSETEHGTFTFKFKKPDFAATAIIPLKRLQKTAGEDRLEFTRNNDIIIVSGDLLTLRYAYLHCFNAENQTKYIAWDKFIEEVPGAKDAFERAVVFDDEYEDEDEEDSKMSHGGNDECSINIYLDDEQGEKLTEIINNQLDNIDVDVDSDGYGGFTVSGILDNVKKIWAAACSVEANKKEPVEFKDLNHNDQEAFWADVEFNDDEIIEPEELDDDIPDSDSDEFWEWYENNKDS
jgi:hypothetical protein